MSLLISDPLPIKVSDLNLPWYLQEADDIAETNE